VDDDVSLGRYRNAIPFCWAVLEFTNGGEHRLLNSLGHNSGQDPRLGDMAIGVNRNFYD
jgi:hypothetical protein